MVKDGELKLALMGEYFNKVVQGHRIVLPSPFRKTVGKSFIITKGYEGSILIVPQKSWKKLIEPMEARSFLDRNVRDTLRFLVGSAFEVSSDTQGRLVVPESLRKYSGVSFSEDSSKEVVFVGLLNWIEVWEKDKWEQRNSMLSDSADDIAQKLVDAGTQV